MNKKRAILLGILTYIISFAFGIISGMIAGIDFETDTEAPNSVWIAGIIFMIIIMYFMTTWYFKDKKIKITQNEGLKLGITFIIIGFILDALIIVPSILFTDAPQDILAYYTNIFFYLTIVAIIATSTITAKLKSKK